MLAKSNLECIMIIKLLFYEAESSLVMSNSRLRRFCATDLVSDVVVFSELVFFEDGVDEVEGSVVAEMKEWGF